MYSFYFFVQGSPCTPFKLREARHFFVQGSPCTPFKLREARHFFVQGSPCTPFKLREARRFFVQGSPETNDNVIEANFCLDHCQVNDPLPITYYQKNLQKLTTPALI
ncbi:MAG: hypothetical protein DRR19_03320 [Candidatus Parabeggiatoa sp. nov. 1]|nr:MAG: hypothetical protein DRR19_03320 [Gammaproteobacteria bacterium]